MFLMGFWGQALYLVLTLLAGGCLYLVVVNRRLGVTRDGPSKGWILLSLWIVIVGGTVGLACLGREILGFWLPGALLFILFVGEIYRLGLRWHYRTAPPIRHSGRPLSIWRPITTTDLHEFHYQVELPGLGLDRLRIVHLSDLHMDGALPLTYFQNVMRRANQVEPDLILISGDFVTHLAFIPLLPKVLGILQARVGIFAIRGNHDYWADVDLVSEAVERSGVEVIPPAGLRMQIGPQSLFLLGCEHPWGNHPCTATPPGKGDMVFALSHSADQVYRLGKSGVRAVFSGHYHAGQFCLPGGVPVVVPGVYGRRFSQGHFYVQGMHLFVSAGIGSGHPPFRIYCPPDFFVVDFKGKQ